jgi:hypothetical protein
MRWRFLRFRPKAAIGRGLNQWRQRVRFRLLSFQSCFPKAAIRLTRGNSSKFAGKTENIFLFANVGSRTSIFRRSKSSMDYLGGFTTM